MTQKIDAYNNAAASIRAGAKPAVAPVPGAANNATDAKAREIAPVDKLSLTGDAQQLHQLEKSIAAIPVADNARVARVRQAISGGTYKIDPQAVAAKLARVEWELRGN